MNWGALFVDLVWLAAGAGLVLLLLPWAVRTALAGQTGPLPGAADVGQQPEWQPQPQQPASPSSQPDAATVSAAAASPPTPFPGSSSSSRTAPTLTEEADIEAEWQQWRIRPTHVFQSPLSSQSPIDGSVLLAGPGVHAPLRLRQPWLVTLLDPQAPLAAWQRLAYAAQQSATALLCPYPLASQLPLPTDFGLIVTPGDLNELSANPEEPGVQQAGLVVLDLRTGLPNWGRWAHTPHQAPRTVARLRPAARDGLPVLRRACRQLQDWVLGAPVALGVGGGPQVPAIEAVWEELGIQGILIWGAPWAGPSAEVGWSVGTTLANWPNVARRPSTPTTPFLLAADTYPRADRMAKALALGAEALVWGVDAWATSPPSPLSSGQTPVGAASPGQPGLPPQSPALAQDWLTAEAIDSLVNALEERGRELEAICRHLGCRRVSQLEPGHLIATPPRLTSPLPPPWQTWPASPPGLPGEAPVCLPTPPNPSTTGNPVATPLPPDARQAAELSQPNAAIPTHPAKTPHRSPRRLRPRPLQPRPLVQL